MLLCSQSLSVTPSQPNARPEAQVIRSGWCGRPPIAARVRLFGPVALGDVAGAAGELAARREALVEEQALPELDRLALAGRPVARVGRERRRPGAVRDDGADFLGGELHLPGGDPGGQQRGGRQRPAREGSSSHAHKL